ncbi:MAG TPA: sigma factor [Solirubrobacteraceae bacterium]|nr:sigma factor [Solirubrobacteraceae bacterium]
MRPNASRSGFGTTIRPLLSRHAFKVSSCNARTRAGHPVAVDARETFERLYREHAGRVKAYGLRRVGSEAAADEVVSDVFLVVWRRLDDVPDDPLPWLLGVARNAATPLLEGTERSARPRRCPRRGAGRR